MSYYLQRVWNEIFNSNQITETQKLNILASMLISIACFSCWVLFFNFLYEQKAPDAVATIVVGCVPTTTIVLYIIYISVKGDTQNDTQNVNGNSSI